VRVRAGRDAGRALFERLGAQGVVLDWREPDVLRFAPVPLYNRFEDVARLVLLASRGA
jgi:kynureninase